LTAGALACNDEGEEKVQTPNSFGWQ